MNFGMFGRLGFAAAAAAAVALFASGLAVGQWVGGRHTADALLEMRKQDAASSAAAVQQAGSAYLSALDKLSSASSSSTANSQDMVAARQAAQTVLHQAANEMVRTGARRSGLGSDSPGPRAGSRAAVHDEEDRRPACGVVLTCSRTRTFKE
jgi:hypothetical protein